MFADVRYTATPAVPDTINDATGKVVYTFSDARPVSVLRIARTR